MRVRDRDFQQADVHGAGKNGLELVAAEATDLAVVPHDRFQSIRDLAEQGIADRVAERIVHVLEAIEVDHEERAALLPMRRVAQGLVERLAHHRPVREAGERVEPRKPADLLLRPALLGKVRADAAEAEEAAALVEDRVARKRPMDVLLARWPDDHIREGEASRQVEAERLALFYGVRRFGLDRQQIGELAPKQLFRLAVEILGELV